MPSKIRILPETLINKIAAGEVIERPASVVKELVENAVDAKATEIFVDIINSGTGLIRVSDNGEGMSKDDVLLAFEKHATSKINVETDLFNIATLGFRGEALPSIASVSRVKVVTKTNHAAAGTMVQMEEGNIKKTSETGAPTGTLVEVADLFYNTPARLKFLKSENTEAGHIVSVINQQAVANPHIHFKLSNNRKELLNFPSTAAASGGSDLSHFYQRINQVFGEDIINNMISIAGGEDGDIRIYGLVSRPSFNRADRSHQDIFLNKRYIKNNVISRAIYDAFHTLLPKNRYPVAILFIDIPPAKVDVNVHPAKREVRFLNQSVIYETVRKIVRDGLLKGIAVTKRSSAGYSSEINEEQPDRSNYFISSPEAKYNAASSISPPFQPFFDKAVYSGSKVVEKICLSAERLVQSEGIVPLGQIDNTYIAADAGGELWLIDQHAAGERILYEKLITSYNNSSIEVQQLLIPEQFNINSAESTVLKDYIDILSDIGIELEEFGRDNFVIRGIPALLGNKEAKQLLLDIIDGLISLQRRPARNEIVDKVIILMACHGAIRANQSLTYKEMALLINDLMKLSPAATCPHGRPVIVKFSKNDLEKMFKRR